MSKSDQSLHLVIQNMIPRYVNGTATNSERDKISSHLKECQQCRDEHEWEVQMHSAIADELAVPEAVIDNDINKFKAHLKREQQRTTFKAPAVSLLERIYQLIKPLVPAPVLGMPTQALGMTAIAGVCAVMVVGILVQQPPNSLVDRSSNIRSCENAEDNQTPRQYQFSVQTTADMNIDIDALRSLVVGTFPGSKYTLTPTENGLDIVVDGTDCDLRVPKLFRQLDDLPAVGQVGISNVER